MPPGLAAIDVAWLEQPSLTIVGIFERGGAAAAVEGSPEVHVWPSPPAELGRELKRYTPAEGWVLLGRVGVAACRLSIAPGGSRIAWCEPHARALTPPPSGARGSYAGVVDRFSAGTKQ